jgi:superfamily II DNA/RNA helicase
MKMVVSKERKRQNRKFIQLDLFIEISVGYCFCNHRDAAERISDTLNEKEFMPRIMVEWIRMKENALIQFRNGSVSYLITTDLAARGLDIPK